mmetsp:Transcript_89162/g.285848  ORF Transcript_89162/g.285848 Transcript_89162/m.285848 type:complete len:243 (+) Transcript_89162:108-836(+)
MARLLRCGAALLVASGLGLAAAGTNEVGLKFLEENKAREGVVVRKSGLQYKVLTKGAGKSHPTKDSPCDCHYAGTTLALTPDAIDKPEAEWSEFDSSYKRGESTTFAPNQVIKAWTEAMQLMVEGDKWELYIPSELGYGDGGSGDKIKGGDMLIFRMEMLTIKGAKKRAVACDLKTQANCEPDEIEVLNAWGKKSIDEILAQLKSVGARLDGTLKTAERIKAKALQKMLKQIQKFKKNGQEL